MLDDIENATGEMQTVNEELFALHQESQSRLDELGRLSSDLTLLLESTGLATLFLDRELKIVRFTPPALEIFQALASDQGRPLADLRHTLRDHDLVADARARPRASCTRRAGGRRRKRQVVPAAHGAVRRGAASRRRRRDYARRHHQPQEGGAEAPRRRSPQGRVHRAAGARVAQSARADQRGHRDPQAQRPRSGHCGTHHRDDVAASGAARTPHRRSARRLAHQQRSARAAQGAGRCWPTSCATRLRPCGRCSTEWATS